MGLNLSRLWNLILLIILISLNILSFGGSDWKWCQLNFYKSWLKTYLEKFDVLENQVDNFIVASDSLGQIHFDVEETESTVEVSVHFQHGAVAIIFQCCQQTSRPFIGE